jgi:hypothetical protein
MVRACGAYVAGRRATVNCERTVAFDEERLAIVKDRLPEPMLSTITGEMIEELPRQAEARWDQQLHSHMDVGVLRKVLKPTATGPAAGPRRDVERGRGRTHRPGVHQR